MTIRKSLAAIAFASLFGALLLTVQINTDKCLETATESMSHMCTM